MAYVSLATPLGNILAEIFSRQAPLSAANFLRYVDEGWYEQAAFYRVVRPDNGLRTPDLWAIQAGIDPTCRQPPLAPIAHESTRKTGLSHVSGSLSMARWELGTAASEFFILADNAPQLDHGGAYGDGYAVFGRVVEGMSTVRTLNSMETSEVTRIPHWAERAAGLEYMADQAIVPVALRIGRTLLASRQQ